MNISPTYAHRYTVEFNDIDRTWDILDPEMEPMLRFDDKPTAVREGVELARRSAAMLLLDGHTYDFRDRRFEGPLPGWNLLT